MKINPKLKQKLTENLRKNAVNQRAILNFFLKNNETDIEISISDIVSFFGTRTGKARLRGEFASDYNRRIMKEYIAPALIKLNKKTLPTDAKIVDGETKNTLVLHVEESIFEQRKIDNSQVVLKSRQRKQQTIAEKSTIPKIESILQKGRSEKAKFFRASGPEWIDFEKGYITERPEVNEIIKEFQKKDLIVIKGSPASGKSVILRNIGYNLANQKKEVYVLELKKTLPDKKEILKLYQGYLFIDDAHLKIEYIDDIVQNLSNVKILVSTRGIERTFGPTCPFKIVEYIRNATEIKGHNSAHEIIQNFSKKEKKITEKIEDKLTKNNLWIMAWELESYKRSNGIDESSVSKTVMNYMQEGLKGMGVEKAENVFLPLSVFYKYVPLREEFFEGLANYKDIERLIKLNEINTLKKDGFKYLTLHHSEVAKLYLKAFQNLKGLGNEIKKKFDEDWLESLFHRYIQRFSEEVTSIIFLRLNFYEPQIVRNLIENNQDEIRKGIEAEKDLSEIGKRIDALAQRNKKYAGKLVSSLDFQMLKDKIEKEQDVWKFGQCIQSITRVNKDAGKKLVSSLDFQMLKDKIEKEQDIWKFGQCIQSITEINKEVAKKLVSILDLQMLKDKIEKEHQLMIVGWCIRDITRANKDIGNKLFSSLDFQMLKDKIEKEQEITQVSCCIFDIACVNKDAGKKLVSSLDFQMLKDKIEKEQEIWKFGQCIQSITRANKDVGNKLFSSLDFQMLKGKIEKEQEIWQVDRCIRYITRANKEVAKKLVGSLDFQMLKNKIEKEQDIWKFGQCISNITRTNKDVGNKLVSSLDFQMLKDKIEKEQEITQVSCCIFDIACVNKDAGKKLVSSLDFQMLKNKIEKEQDITQVSCCIRDIACVNKDAGKKLVSSLDFQMLKDKINSEQDISKVRHCIQSITEINKEVAKKLGIVLDI